MHFYLDLTDSRLTIKPFSIRRPFATLAIDLGDVHLQQNGRQANWDKGRSLSENKAEAALYLFSPFPF